MTAFNPQGKPGSINHSIFQRSSKGKGRLNHVPPRTQLTGDGLGCGPVLSGGPGFARRPRLALASGKRTGSGFHTELPGLTWADCHDLMLSRRYAWEGSERTASSRSSWLLPTGYLVIGEPLSGKG